MKLQDAVVTNDVLVMGSDNVVGLTDTQLKTALQITDTTYNSGRNITIHATTNDLNLNTTLTSVNSIKSVTDTDLNLESTGTGDILLRANPAAGTLGNIHLLRNDAARFNTIEYKNHPSSAYINFLVHDGNTATSQTEVLKLNGDGVAEFSGEISVNSIKSVNNTDLKLESKGNGDVLLKANPSVSGTGKILLSRADSDDVRSNTIEYRNYPGSAYIKFLVHNGSDNTSQTELLKLNGSC